MDTNNHRPSGDAGSTRLEKDKAHGATNTAGTYTDTNNLNFDTAQQQSPPPIPYVPATEPRPGHDCPECQVWERLRFFAPAMPVEHLLTPVTRDLRDVHAAVNRIRERRLLDPADIAAFGRAVTYGKHAAASLCDTFDRWADLVKMLHTAIGTVPTFDHCQITKGRTDTNRCIEWQCPAWQRGEGKVTLGTCALLPTENKGGAVKDAEATRIEGGTSCA
ncbi:MAG: hypothetical protein P4L96_13485 [Rhodoferax sp.]|nr:hypothetical protein [Rhodoferax sp.]